MLVIHLTNTQATPGHDDQSTDPHGLRRAWTASEWTASDDRVRGGKSQVCFLLLLQDAAAVTVPSEMREDALATHSHVRAYARRTQSGHPRASCSFLRDTPR